MKTTKAEGTRHDDAGDWWRVEAKCPLVATPFVDWYRAATEAEALALWAEDAHRYQLPNGTTATARLATADEVKACEARG